MTVETKSDLKTVAGILGATAVALIVGVNFTPSLSPAPKVVTLIWDVNEPDLNVVTEVWSSTNLTMWQLKTNVSGTNRVTLPADKPREFFKVRNKLQIGTNVFFSDWSRK